MNGVTAGDFDTTHDMDSDVYKCYELAEEEDPTALKSFVTHHPQLLTKWDSQGLTTHRLMTLSAASSVEVT